MPPHRLTASAVAAARREARARPRKSIAQIAREAHLPYSALRAAVRGESWSWLTDPPPVTKPRKRLTLQQVTRARRAVAAGSTVQYLAQKWGVSDEALRRAVRGETWAKMTSPPPVPVCKKRPVLTRERVAEARRQVNAGMPVPAFADAWDIHPSTLANAVHGRTWSSVRERPAEPAWRWARTRPHTAPPSATTPGD